MKGFWLDEWFILKNLKFRSYAGLFDNLYVMQQFPRVYLAVIKFVAELSNYNYFALRVFPFVIQVINILLLYFIISKIIFPFNKVKALFFVLFFLSFHTTLFYFSQLKQYTMDMLFTLASVWYFYYLSQNYSEINIKSSRYIGMLVCIFIGPFFSYTFPIVLTPIMLLLFITSLIEAGNKNLSLKPLLPLIIFALALVINYFTDLRFVLNDTGQYHNFDQYVMNYKSINLMGKGLLNIAWLFTSVFFFDKAYSSTFLYFLYFIKIMILILSVLGFSLIIYKHIKKLKIEKVYYFKSLNSSVKSDIELFFLLLFLVTIFLYLIKMLPVGTHRINYFCVIYITYFVVKGAFYAIKKFNKLKYLLVPILVFAASFPAISSSINELKNTNLNFDQKIYDNVGNAINVAKANSLPIFVAFNEFYPKSIEKGVEGLMIKSHHAYKPKDNIPVYVYKNGELKGLLQRFHLKNYILIQKYSYQVLSNN